MCTHTVWSSSRLLKAEPILNPDWAKKGEKGFNQNKRQEEKQGGTIQEIQIGFTLLCRDNDLTCFVGEIWSHQVSLCLLSPRGCSRKKKKILKTGVHQNVHKAKKHLEWSCNWKQFGVIIERSLSHRVIAEANIKGSTHTLALTRSLQSKHEWTTHMSKQQTFSVLGTSFTSRYPMKCETQITSNTRVKSKSKCLSWWYISFYNTLRIGKVFFFLNLLINLSQFTPALSFWPTTDAFGLQYSLFIFIFLPCIDKKYKR